MTWVGPRSWPERRVKGPVAGYGYSCNGKAATIVGTKKGEVINGTPGDDVIVALDGNDTVYGGDGTDTATGGSGKNTFRQVERLL